MFNLVRVESGQYLVHPNDKYLKKWKKNILLKVDENIIKGKIVSTGDNENELKSVANNLNQHIPLICLVRDETLKSSMENKNKTSLKNLLSVETNSYTDKNTSLVPEKKIILSSLDCTVPLEKLISDKNNNDAQNLENDAYAHSVGIKNGIQLQTLQIDRNSASSNQETIDNLCETSTESNIEPLYEDDQGSECDDTASESNGSNISELDNLEDFDDYVVEDIYDERYLDKDELLVETNIEVAENELTQISRVGSNSLANVSKLGNCKVTVNHEDQKPHIHADKNIDSVVKKSLIQPPKSPQKLFLNHDTSLNSKPKIISEIVLEEPYLLLPKKNIEDKNHSSINNSIDNDNRNSNCKDSNSTFDSSALVDLQTAFDDAVRDDSSLLNTVQNLSMSLNLSSPKSMVNDSCRKSQNCSIISLPSTSWNEMSTENESENLKDQNYIPDTEDSLTENTFQNDSEISAVPQQATSEQSVIASIKEINSTNVSPTAGAPDPTLMYVAQSGIRKRKKNFCFYCQSFQANISRHLETIHPNEDLVKAFTSLKKGTRERWEALQVIRIKGDDFFNRNSFYNDGELLVARQPRKRAEGMPPVKASDFKLCHKCNGRFLSIDRHRLNCLDKNSIDHRRNPILTRLKEGNIHENASEQFRRVAAVFKVDDISNLIKYDESFVSFGNDLCLKYTKQQQHDLIRARLRLLATLLRKVQKFNPTISCLSQLIDSKSYNDIIKGVKDLVGSDDLTRKCRAPSTATTCGTWLGKAAKHLRKEYIKTENYEAVKKIEYFLDVHEVEYPLIINTLAYEIQGQNKRQKQEILPAMDDINIFRNYLECELIDAFSKLVENYSYESWLKLNKTPLILILLFNRKRPGEVERVFTADYNSSTSFCDLNTDFYNTFNNHQKQLLNFYKRIEITGKKYRGVPLLLSLEMQEAIELLLEHRQNANIHENNPFIFALPGYDGSRYKYLRACELMRNFAEECGAKRPKTLRLTKLRKHLATTVASLEIDECRTYDVSNFMGHAEKIHRDYYRQPTATRDICGVSELLEVASGVSNSNRNDIQSPSTSQQPSSRPDKDPKNLNSRGIKINSGNTLKTSIRKRRLILDSSEESSESELSDGSVDKANLARKFKINKKRDKKIMKTNYLKKNKSVKDQSLNFDDENEKGKAKKPKTTWTEEERRLVTQAFQDCIDKMKLPSVEQIRKLKNDHPELNRTEAQIRLWVRNQYARQLKASKIKICDVEQ